MIRLLIISLLFISCKGNSTQMATATAVSYQKQRAHLPSDSLLMGIQQKIADAFVLSLMTKNNNELNQLSKKLELIYNQKKQPLILYWRAYLQFYSSIYYLKKGDKKMAEKEVDKGIDWLTNLKSKNSEDYALLAMLQGFAIQFKGMKAMFISGDIKKNAKQAMAIDPTNIRGYYVYASNDFHTPKKYGGGTEAEKYLLKSIALPAQKIKNKYLPSWGKEESYELLIKIYIKQEQWDVAKKYFQEGIKAYPKSYTINQLSSKLISQ